MKYACLLSFLLAGFLQTSAQGCLDSTFAENGIKNYWDNIDEIGVPYIQNNDGSVLILCSSIHSMKFKWRRLLPDGNDDLTFGVDGIYEYPLEGYLSARYLKHFDGSLFLGLYHEVDNSAKYLKLKPDLTIDSTYGENGIARIKKLVDSSGIKVWKNWTDFSINEEVIQPDGKILIASAYYWGDSLLLLRIDQDGQIDTTFGHSGSGYSTYHCGAYPRITGLSVAKNGRIIVSGSSYDATMHSKLMIMAFLPDGTPDSSFNHTGVLHTDLGLPGFFPYCNDQILLPDGKIVLTGILSVPFLAQFNPDGKIDSSFNEVGYLKLPDNFSPSKLHFQSNRILIRGKFGDLSHEYYGMVRYLPDGAIDSAFCNNGIFEYKPEIFRDVSISAWAVDTKYVYILGAVQMPFEHPVEVYGQLLRIHSPDEIDVNDICGTLYPNPTTGDISIKDTSVYGNYIIYDNLGREVTKGELKPDSNLNVSMLPVAIYYIVVQSEGNKQCRYKFVKK